MRFERLNAGSTSSVFFGRRASRWTSVRQLVDALVRKARNAFSHASSLANRVR
jgi:hypothetical protein